MTVYFFEAITPEQALSFGPGDSLRFLGAGASPATVSLTYSGGNVRMTFDGATVTFGPGFSAAQRSIFPNGPDLLLTGSDQAESLAGGAGNDVIYGGAGADTLSGGAGPDRMSGGAGADLFVIGLRESVVGQMDTILDFQSEDRLFFANGVSVVASYYEATFASFTEARNYATVEIEAGRKEIIVAGVGTQVFVFVDSNNQNVFPDVVALDNVSLAQIGPSNFVDSTGAVAPPEVIDRINSDDTLAGDAGPNTINGQAGNDTISGGGGADSLIGGVGDDRLQGDDGADTLEGQAGADTGSGGAGDDSLVGGEGGDVLQGDDGADTLQGGAGADTLSGGAGNDLFIFVLGETRNAAGDLDVITDIRPGDRLVFGGGQLASGMTSLSGARTFAEASALANAAISTGEVNFVVVDVFGSGPLLFVDSRNDDGEADEVVSLGSFGNRPDGASFVTAAPPPGAPALPTAPTFTFGGGGTVRIAGDMDHARLEPALKAIITAASEVIVEASAGDIRLRMTGFGFSADSAGHLNGGTMNAVTYPYGAADGGPFSMSISGPQAQLVNMAFWLANDLTQDMFANLLNGNDRIDGGTGVDVLRGYGGNDLIDGQGGADTLWGGAGNDLIYVARFNSTNTPVGSTYLRGEEGDDYIIGSAGFDDINGNQGADTGSGGEGNDWVVGGRDNDLLFGDAGSDLVYGNLGDDTCVGGAGADTVRGGQGNDLVFGGDGADYVSGDKGDDTMTGGAGADIFHSFGDAGIDRVTDFNMSQDRVQLDPGTQYSLAQVGADTVISMTGGGQMILVGITMSALPAGWIFGA